MSRGMADRLGSNRTVVQPLPIHRSFTQIYDRDAIRREAGCDPAAFYILFPSSPSREVKRYDVFERVVDRIQSQLGKCCILTLPGSMSPEEVVKVYYQADLVILCSRHEGSPQSAKEALACGTPLASFDLGDVRDLTNNIEGTKVVPLGDEDALLEASIALLRQRIRVKGIERLRQLSLTEDRFAERMFEIYESAGIVTNTGATIS